MPTLPTDIQGLAERIDFLEYAISWKQSSSHKTELENLKSDPATCDLTASLFLVRISFSFPTYVTLL